MGPKTAERIETETVPGVGARVKVFDDADGGDASMEIDVDFAWRDGEPIEVHAIRVRSRDRLTGATLQRLPWARYLAAADAITRLAKAKTREEIRAAMRAGEVATSPFFGELPPSGKPGRKPLPDDHYREIAERYLELRRSGSTNPVRALADERHENRNTVAAKVRKARERGFLLEGRPGRAG